MKKIVIIFLGLLLASCEDILFAPDKASSDPFVNFDYLWEEVDKKYSYFALKNIDWDAVRTSYRAKISADMSEEALFEVLADMLNELRDDHVNLFSPFNISRYDIALRSEANYLARTVQEHYLPNGRITGSFFHDFLPGGQVAYVRYSSFMAGVSNMDLDHILERYANTKGLILDLRENGGGSIFNIPMILERFVAQRTLVAYSITRNGPLRTDFSEPVPFHFNPHDGIRYEKPVVVLVDRGSYSASTFFALTTKALPNITLVGDTTGGGGGLPNGGQLPNGWTYRFSITQILDLDKRNFAEDGVPPDVRASFDWNDLTKDEVLEAGIELLIK